MLIKSQMTSLQRLLLTGRYMEMQACRMGLSRRH